MEFIQESLFGRMLPGLSQQTKERTSESSLRRSSGSSVRPMIYLDLVVEDGLQVDLLRAFGGVWDGDVWMPNTGESPKEEIASSLSQILMGAVPKKYYLSAKACTGILRRSHHRGKILPKILESVLLRQAGVIEADQVISRTKSTFSMSGFGDDYRESPISATLRNSRQGDETIVLSTSGVRRLTPIECARLQGFPDDWCADVPHSDAVEYKMWGNGMALPCSLYIMEGIEELMKGEKHGKDI